MNAKRFTVVAGCSGSGKSTFVNRYLLNDRGLTLRCLFDPDGEFAERLRLPVCTTPAQLDKAAQLGWVAFDPSDYFPGDLMRGFAFFCAWTLALAKVQKPGGRTVIVVDEVWKYCDPYKVPPELALIVQTGRKHGCEGVFLTQRPNKVNGTVLNEATELVCFRLSERAGVDKVEEYGLDPDEVRNLPLGSFVALNTNTGGRLRGKVF